MLDQNDLRRAVLQAIHRAHAEQGIGPRLVLCVTGGGSLAISDLLTEPGASHTVRAAHVPYSGEALCKYLRSTPEQFCSEPTARQIAMAAWCEAEVLHKQKNIGDPNDKGISHLLGIGCTASLASDQPKRGAHRVHFAWQNLSRTGSVTLELEKNARTRLEEERLAADLLLNAIAELVGIEIRVPLKLHSSEVLVRNEQLARPELQQLFAGQIHTISADLKSILCKNLTERDTESNLKTENQRAIFPGSFNPLHDGHSEMASIAAEMLKIPVEFEISVTNVDKPPLDYIEMHNRATQFSAERKLWWTRAPMFVEKSDIFQGSTFIIGVDTIVRIADPRYYQDAHVMHAAIKTIAANGCRFLVFGRVVKETQKFLGLNQCNLPVELLRICTEVPPEKFRHDISSTELRKKADN